MDKLRLREFMQFARRTHSQEGAQPGLRSRSVWWPDLELCLEPCPCHSANHLLWGPFRRGAELKGQTGQEAFIPLQHPFLGVLQQLLTFLP